MDAIPDRTQTSCFNATAHLNWLAVAGFVARRREGSKVYYRVDDVNLPAFCSWICDSLRRRARSLAANTSGIRSMTRSPKIAPFEQQADRYEAWFGRYPAAYQSELAAVREMVPAGEGLEVGVGTGRFAGPLGIRVGVEPSARMRSIARQRGIDAIDGVAEALPYPDASFDVVLMVTTICFVNDLDASLREAHRVLSPGGHLVIGFIDRDSPLGRDYQVHRAESIFYVEASFYSAREVRVRLERADFSDLNFRQTIFTPLADVTALQPSRESHGQGSFVAVRANRN